MQHRKVEPIRPPISIGAGARRLRLRRRDRWVLGFASAHGFFLRFCGFEEEHGPAEPSPPTHRLDESDSLGLSATPRASSPRPRAVPCGTDEQLDAARGPARFQYSPLITKYEPRIVPASFDFCLANLNFAS